MKLVRLALLVISCVVAQAASHEAASQEAASPKAPSPEDSYYASRDAFITKFTAISASGKIDDDALRLHALAIDQLGKLLRPIVGPVAIKGFSGGAKSNLDSLFKGDFGFGRLDGLRYSSADDKTRIVVTTDALFRRWLREHKDWWVASNVPQDVNAALRSEAFYTQALSTDAAVFKYVEVPVAKLVRAKSAFAMLIARSQALGPRRPDELIVATEQGDRVFVASAPTNPKIGPMPLCQKIWQQSERKALGAGAAHVASERKDDPLSDQRDQTEEQGDAAYRECFAQQAKRQGFLAVLTFQAQALVYRLP